MVELYKKALPTIKLYGPTYFAEIMKQQIKMMKANEAQTKTYSVLLILTDGEIHDMAQTKDLFVDASHLPLSVVIVGVGNEDFHLMKELDSDGKLLSGSHGKADRDFVQFVKYKDFESGEHLAEEVLKEIPN